LFSVSKIEGGEEVRVHQGESHDVRVRPYSDGAGLPRLGAGDKVCVRDRFLGNWSSGFAVASVVADGYLIQRLSDGLTFPDVFRFDDVRLERRQEPDRGIAGSYLDRGA
jgi:hypothetical protein